jgi:two-component system chemotaxis response regulator CheB
VHNGANDRPKAAVAVAASAGGVEALVHFVEGLPEEFDGAVLVVLHLSETGTSVLPHILARATVLDVVPAGDEQPLRRGCVVVAPPGLHLRVRDHVTLLDRGPRENGHRPSADALFHSVAEAFGSRSAGVVLSGTLDDGATGLKAVAVAGGLTVVEDPSEAAFPGMPLAAIAEAHPAIVCRVREMGAKLAAWMESLPPETDPPRSRKEQLHPGGTGMGELSEFTCPECGGTLWLVDSYGSERYRCRVGHTFSADALLSGKQEALEAALWAAVVALEERADLFRRMLRRLESTGRTSQLERYREDVDLATERIDVLRDLIKELVLRGVLTEAGDEERDAEPTR